MKKPPCRGCDYERMSKSCQACTDCTARVAYADSVDLAGLILHSSRMVRPSAVVKAVMNEPNVKETPMKDEKACSKCGEEYPRTEVYFYKNPNCKDGFDATCKTCRSIMQGVKNPGKRGPKPRLKKTAQGEAPAAGQVSVMPDADDPISLIFKDCPQLHARLILLAEKQYRTEKAQLLWMVESAAEREGL